MFVRRFEEFDAEEISSIICRNSLEVNIADYPLAQMQAIVDKMTPMRVGKLAAVAHTYVACDNEVVVGTGTVDCWWGSKTESMLRMLFVLPERHGQGIGRLIVEALEADELFLRADIVHVPASITACGFYEKMGYRYRNGARILDDEGHYNMVKVKHPQG